MKISLFTVLFFFSVVSYSQSRGIIKYAKYYSTELKKNYGINVSEDYDGNITFYIELSSLDAADCKALINLNESEVESFKNYLISLKKTFKEWKEVAVKNKVSSIAKDIDYEFPCLTSFFQCGSYDWGSNRTTCLTSYFKLEKTKVFIRIKAYDLFDNAGNHPKSKGVEFIFVNEKDFDSIISKLDIAVAKKYIIDTKAKESLFKN